MMVNLNFHLYLEDFVEMRAMFNTLCIPNKQKLEMSMKYQKFHTPHKTKCGSGLLNTKRANLNIVYYHHDATVNFLLFCRFYSNWDVSAHGFKLFYESVPLSCIDENNVVDQSGYLSSVRYPFNYVGNPDCIYILSFKNGMTIKISIHDIQLKKTEKCIDSFLEIRDGKFNTSPLMNKLCGSTSDVPKALQSSGPDVWIR